MIDKNLNIYESLCTGCSACTEVCHSFDKTGKSAIQLIVNRRGLMIPQIDREICTKCKMCHNACPGESRIFNGCDDFEDYVSKVGSCYYGYSLDTNHRFEAATAGIVTEIAAYLLDTKQVDGVVGSYQSDDNKIITEIFTCSKKVRSSSGSIYRQVPLYNGLMSKIEAGGFKSLLVIGLPCQIASLELLIKINKCLGEIHFFTVALFCKQTKEEKFSDIERWLLRSDSGRPLIYRGKGWPGITRVEGKDGLPFNSPKLSLMWGSFAFTPEYCFFCNDPLGINADISVGDAWLKKYYDDKLGSSLFIANSEKGVKLLKDMVGSDKIFAETESIENLLLSQNRDSLKFKFSSLKARRRSLGKCTFENNDQGSYLFLLRWVALNKMFVEAMYRTKIVKYIPDIILKLYGRISRSVFRKMAIRKI